MTDLTPSPVLVDAQTRIGASKTADHAYASYVETAPGQPAALNLLIENLHCPSCIREIEAAYDEVPDMVEARVNLTTRRLLLRWRGRSDRADDLVRRVTSLGFSVAPFHPHDISSILDQQGVAIRGGHHCAMPLHQHFGIRASCRASFYLYNTAEEVDALVEGVEAVERMFGK